MVHSRAPGGAWRAEPQKNTTRDEEGGSEVWPCSRELGTGTTMHKNSTISHL